MEQMEHSVASQSRGVDRWARVPVVAQASEAADTSVICASKWSRIYRLFSATGESAQDEVFGAVNFYFLKNGSSPRGKYSKPIRTAGGVEIDAGEVVQITGRNEGEIRQFLRGRLHDSYLFLKHNQAVGEDPDVVAKAQNAGIPRHQAWLLADWLGENCPHFVGDEATVYRSYRASTIALANQRQRTAGETEDKVVSNAPEARTVGPQPAQSHYNTSLF